MLGLRNISGLAGTLARLDRYEDTETLFLRVLGLIYLFAFASLTPQVVGLFGSTGIAPIERTLENARLLSGYSGPALLPSVFWLGVSNNLLKLTCMLGCFGGIAAAVGLIPRVGLAICWVLYLSLVTTGAPFTNFQWDALLLEAGFLALWAGTPILVWGYRFLLFRLMFESGLVKLQSGDINWRNLRALSYHFYTQPLPTPLAYYVAHLPERVLKALTGAALGIELIVPFLLFAPRTARLLAASLLAALQIGILLTGNYGFFNLLTLALCLWGLDDQITGPIRRALPAWQLSYPKLTQFRVWRVVSTIAVAVILGLGILEVTGSNSLQSLRRTLAPYDVVNSYGLFAVMTTTRSEIILEGSNDAKTWLAYEFPFKPGDPHRRLPLATPSMPRLDWQMWFAALGTFNNNPWLGSLMYRLLTGEPAVRDLLLPHSFRQSPKYLRALSYSYRFTTPEERTRTGDVWHRDLRGIWFGPVSLTGR